MPVWLILLSNKSQYSIGVKATPVFNPRAVYSTNTGCPKCPCAVLLNFFILQLQMLHLVNNTIFQQDGAPCQYALCEWQFLDDTFSDWWISTGGPLAWPPQSPDLSPLDFFLWGHIKTCACITTSFFG